MMRTYLGARRHASCSRRRRFRRVAAEQLEDRRLLAGDIDFTLDALLDQFGYQPEISQAYDDKVSWGSIFDTGASLVSFSATDQYLFESYQLGDGIPIKVPGGAQAEGIGGILTGDVSQPGTVLVDGFHTSVWSMDIFSDESGLYFDQIQGRGSVDDATPAATQFTGNDRLNVEPGIYNGYSLLFTSTAAASSANMGQSRTITAYDGPSRTFTFASAFPVAPSQGDAFHILVGQGVTGGPLPARDRLSAAPAGLGLSGVDGAYIGRYLLFTSGDLAGESQLITGYEGATHTFTFGLSFSQRPAVGDTFDIIVGTGSSAVMPGVQVFVGTLDGSELLSTLGGTPMLNPTEPLAAGATVPNPLAGPQPMHPAGLALKVGPQNLLLDLGAILGDLFPDGMFDGITMPIPSVEFREPGTQLEVLESFHAETTVDAGSVTPTAGQFAGGSELPYDPDNPGLFQDFYTGFYLRFLTGSLTDEIREVATYDAATRTFAFATPFSGAPAAGDLFELVRISTEPVTLALDLIEFDNHLDPGDIMTVSPNPVSEQVRLAESVASGQVVSAPALDQLVGGNQPEDSDPLSDLDDAYNGLTLVLTSGPLAGERVAIADYVGATHTFQLQTSLSATPAAGATFEVFDESAALDDQVFLFDTGAQLSVISTAEAEALGLLDQPPEFTASVQGAGGVVADLPGYTLDEFSIPTLEGGRLVLRNAPVFVLDVAPMLDGILGMNLFNNAAEFLYDPFDPLRGHPTLQVTFFEERAEVVTEIDIEGADAAWLQAVADLMPLAFGQAVGLHEISMPTYGAGVDLDLTPQNGLVREENGVTVVTVAPGTEIQFTARVPYTAEPYDSARLDFGASDDALGLRDWTSNATDWTATDGTLAVPGDPEDAVVRVEGSAQWWSTLGTFVVDAPFEPGDYVLTADDGAGGTLFGRSESPLPIRDFGSIIIRVPATPTLAIGDATLVEGGDGTVTDLEFTVTLTGSAGGTVVVDWATADGSAVAAGGDYTATTAGSLQFAVGESQKTITVPVHGDAEPEDHEDFFVQLSNARIDIAPLDLAPISDATAIDEDGDLFDLLLGEPFETIDTESADLLKAVGALGLGTPAKAFALEFDVSDIPVGTAIDSAILTFVEDADNLTTPISIQGYEGNSGGTVELEHPFNTRLDNPVGTVGDGVKGSETIVVTDFIQGLVDNGLPFAGFYVEGATATDQYFVLSSETANSDHRPRLTIHLDAGSTSVAFADSQAVATIRNDDTLVSISDRQQVEGDAGTTQAPFVVQLSHPSALDVIVDYATADGTAVAGDDYGSASGSVAFAPGETAKAISVAILGDLQPESNETYFVNLSEPQNATLSVGQEQGTGTVSNDDAAQVVGRHVFYNNSAWDGNDAAANAADDAAIAPGPSIPDPTDPTYPDELPKEQGKTALLPGQTATFANYTSYSSGLNGIMVDIAGLAGTPTETDFVFQVGNNSDPDSWAAAPSPQSITVRPDEGVDGSDRVTLIWADDDPYTPQREPGSISKQWLQITVLATANTGLAAADVFYFGNAIGECGNSTTETNVDTNDEIGARNHPHSAFSPAPRYDAYDFNRDKKVDTNDEIIARNNATSAFTRLKLITAPASPASDAAPAAEPPLGDALQVPDEVRSALMAGPAQAGQRLLGAGPPAGQAPYGAAWYDTTEYMLGDVWVTVVLLESNGGIDAQTESWTTAEIGQVKSEIQEGLAWWEDTLAARTPTPLHSLDFHIDFTYADAPVATPYEPINRPQSDEGLWIDSFLNHVGYNSPNNRWYDLYDWNHDQRIAHNAHWAYTVFVVDSSADPDGKFPDNYFAYAYVGGPFTVMTYDNNGWGISRMGQVLAHETGHIFYARDEYPDSDSYTVRSGYYNTQNLNAYDGHPNPSSRVASIMAEAALQNAAYPAHTSSPTSLQMLGWLDSDADGIFDVLDVPLTLTGSGSYNAAAGRYEFTGTSSVQTLDNLNSFSSGNDITINTVDRIQYRLDGGNWIDGNAYGTYTANVAQDVTADGNLHTIEFRTIVAQTGLSSPVWSDTFGNENDPPAVVDPIDDVTVAEDAANTVIDLGPVFSDPDLGLGDALTYTVTVTEPIDSLVAQVSQSSYTTLHQDLLYTHTGDNRGVGGWEHDLARENIQSYFVGLGLDTSLEPFTYSSQTYYNVVGVHEGVTAPDDIYLVGAHYDSVNNPGADDNASGVAAVMELARVLTQYQFDATLVFVAFDREEQGLYGSYAYVAAHNPAQIKGMLSLDMIAYNPAGANYDKVRFYDSNGVGTIKSDLAAAFATYSGGLATTNSGTIGASDHHPFELAGVDAALVIEYNVWSNPHYHKATDAVETAGNIDYVYAAKVTRGVMGYLATKAGLRGPSQLLAATVDGQDLTLDYAADEHGLADVTVRATDTQSLYVEDTFRVTVGAVNDAPVLDNTGLMTLSAIDEDDVTNPGTLVRDIVLSAGGDRITDADYGAWEGLAVTAVDNTHGTWQYTVNNGRTWLAFGTPTAATARLLGSDAGTRIRFVPAPDWHGTVDPAITFRAWDHTQGASGQTADATAGGGATAFSAVPETAAITVNPLAPLASVVGRYVFYNNSAWDGYDPDPSGADDNALAPPPSIPDPTDPTYPADAPKEQGKTALLPGQTATFANYTSYSSGLNGIMVDIAALAGTPTDADFVFKVGNTSDPDSWAAAPSPQSITVRPDEGVHGSDRVTLIWADDDPYTPQREPGSISKQWLQITVLATANTGLAAADVFCFGNAIGECGNSTTETNVDTNDEIGARNHPHSAFSPAPRYDAYDFNRDKKVDTNDEIIARNNATSAFTRLQLITAPLAAGSPAGGAAPAAWTPLGGSGRLPASPDPAAAESPSGPAAVPDRPIGARPSWPKMAVGSVVRTDPRSGRVGQIGTALVAGRAESGHGVSGLRRAADQVFAEIGRESVAGTRRTPVPVSVRFAAEPGASAGRLAERWQPLELEDVLPLLAGADSGDPLAGRFAAVWR